MRSELNWQAVDVIGCMTLTWGVHKGLRVAMTPAPRGSLVYLRKVVEDFKGREVPSLASVGEDIANRIKAVVARPAVRNLGLGELTTGVATKMATILRFHWVGT